MLRNAVRRGEALAGTPSEPVFDPTSIPSLGGVTRVRHAFNDVEHDAFGLRMTPPEVFCLDENPAETLAFIHDFREVRLLRLGLPDGSERRLRSRYRGRWIGSYTDIAAIRRITPAAALVLASEFDRAVRRNRIGRRGVVNARAWNPGVARMLIDIGFLQHMNANLPDYQQVDPSPPEKRMLPMLTGNRNEPEQILSLRAQLQSLMDSVLDSVLNHAIYDGLIEAMDNCAAHAYPEDHEFRYPMEQQRWWMSGSVANDRELEVIFFDQGATIPGTLPRSGKREIARHWLSEKLNLVGIDAADDGQRIHAAMETGRSMFRQQGRGHGLAQMRSLVDLAPSGSLRILSRKGRYIYEKDAGERVDTLDGLIGGTLIHWRFRL
ncbi:MAG: hypothetical protein OXN89_04685 [Bryobacterales bacterium]|nr:hypothetical protein [Bryobacterales bacterium]